MVFQNVCRSGTAPLLALLFASPVLGQSSGAPRMQIAVHTDTGSAAPKLSTEGGLEHLVTLQLVDASLEDALEAVAREAGLTLGYSPDLLPKTRRVSIDATDRTAGAIFDQVLQGTGLERRVISEHRVTLVRQPDSPRVSSRTQTGTIVGRVADAETEAGLSGATVRLDGAARGTLTGTDGRFRLQGIPDGPHTLTASLIGYSHQSRRVIVAPDRTTTANFDLVVSAVPLDQVVVTGAVVPTEVRAIPTPVNVITAAEIQAQNISRIDQLFRGQMPGSFAWDQGASDHYSTIMVRGINSFRVNSIKTYLDGVELSSSAFALIDPNSIERVEIIRGPEASTIYGSDASGGVMQIFTKRGATPLERPQLAAELSAGLIETPHMPDAAIRQNHTVTLRGGDNDLGYNIGAAYERSGEWLPEYFAKTPSVFAGIRTTQGQFTLDLSARSVRRIFGVTQNPEAVAAGYLPFSKPRYQNARVDQQTYGATLSYAPVAWWTHQLVFGVDQTQNENTRYQPRLTTAADTFLSVINAADGKTSAGYNTSITTSLGEHIGSRVTLGADQYERWSTSALMSRARTIEGSIVTDPIAPPITARNRITNNGYFAQAQLDYRNALFLTAGIRADRSSGFGTNYGTAYAPRIGISYVQEFTAFEVKLRSAYGEGIRAPLPTQRDARQTNSYSQIANSSLGPERQVGWDGGVELYLGSGASFEATYYDQTAVDLIDFVLVEASAIPPIYQYQNVGRIKNQGWEFEGKLSHSGVNLSATYSITNSTVRALSPSYRGELRVGDRLLLVPRHTGGASVSLTPLPGTSLSARATYVGSWTSQDYLALYAFYYGGEPYRGSMRDYWRSYPGFVKVNVGLAQRLGSGLEGFVTVDNVGNRTPVEQNNLFTTYGRVSTLGLRLRY